MRGKVLCITGIDTDIGKSVATGLLARFLANTGKRVITQKLCQTGCEGISEDIALHRRIMGVGLLEEDHQGLTCPYIFSEPCSPHLAARLDGSSIDPEMITKATEQLRSRFDYVIVEGVGGLMVPLLPDLYLADYLAERDYFHILVSSPRLGSINHTLAALEILGSRRLDLAGIIYNRHVDSHPEISADSRHCFQRYLDMTWQHTAIIDMFALEGYGEGTDSPDFSPLLKAIEER